MPVILTILVLMLVAFALAVDTDAAPPLFAEDLRESLVGVERSSTQFRSLIEGIGAVDRATLETTAEDALASLDAAREAMGAAPPGDPELTGPMAILDEVLSSWGTGVSSFHDLVLRAADEPLAVGLEIEITDALIDLRSGDRLYRSFVTSMDAADTPAPVVAYPEIAFVSESYPFSTGPTQIVTVARTEGNELALRAELAIGRIATIPDMVVNTSDQNVIPYTDSLVIQVVVVNSGNTESQPIDVLIELAGNDGSSISTMGTAAAMAAGAETTVEFPDTSVTPGATYELVVRLALVEGEQESEDNLRELRFTVNEETPPSTTAAE